MDFYGFYTGQEFEAYRFLGAHPAESAGTVFRTFAPNAASVGVIGDFNAWQEQPMNKIYDGNFWELMIPEAKEGMRYKYRIHPADGPVRDHCDPYGFSSELRPNTASVICRPFSHCFQDAKWMRNRSAGFDRPLNIYELHFGSWKKKGEKETDWYSYAELAPLLLPYLKENGYNFVELMPLAEYPSDASWGYQETGYFAPTSRYGTPEELQEFVDLCHQAGIGVLLDFVPVHFAPDDYALWRYDGTALYEYPSSDVGFSQWGSCNFMHSRGEVRSFLQSSAYYWLTEYHFDGLRMDAISNLIYWQGQPERGTCQPGIQFLQNMNAGLKKRLPGIILAAEDSTAFPGITAPVSRGGLGFDYKWDMGWMNDTLNYFRTDPALRPEHRGFLTFSMDYFFQERYLLPLSHDESVHGKATVLQKMYGDYEDKFPQGRAFYLYMMGHPGKKLNFMGNEFGQLREWDEKREQDWNLLSYPKHSSFLRFMKDLNQLYLSHPALYLEDFSRNGFRWLDCRQENGCVFAFERLCAKESLLFLFNFSSRPESVQLTGLDGAKSLETLLDTDQNIYGGGGSSDSRKIPVTSGQAVFYLAPFSGRCCRVVPLPPVRS